MGKKCLIHTLEQADYIKNLIIVLKLILRILCT